MTFQFPSSKSKSGFNDSPRMLFSPPHLAVFYRDKKKKSRDSSLCISQELGMISWLTPEETVTALGYFLYRYKCQPQICTLIVSVCASLTGSASLFSDAETGLEIHQVSRPPGLNTERRRSRAVLYQLSGHLQKQDKTKSKLKINNVRRTWIYWLRASLLCPVHFSMTFSPTQLDLHSFLCEGERMKNLYVQWTGLK